MATKATAEIIDIKLPKQPMMQLKEVRRTSHVMFEGQDGKQPETPKVNHGPKITKMHTITTPDTIRSVHTLQPRDKMMIHDLVENLFTMIAEKREDMKDVFITDDMFIDELFWVNVEEYIRQVRSDIYTEKLKALNTPEPTIKLDGGNLCREFVNAGQNK